MTRQGPIHDQPMHYLGGMPLIRSATAADGDAIWEILEPAFRAGETYTVARDITREDALAYWLSAGHDVFIAEEAANWWGPTTCAPIRKAAERTWPTAAT
jgi:hypothetical protein